MNADPQNPSPIDPVTARIAAITRHLVGTNYFFEGPRTSNGQSALTLVIRGGPVVKTVTVPAEDIEKAYLELTNIALMQLGRPLIPPPDPEANQPGP